MTQIRLRWLTIDKSENIVRYYVRMPGRLKVRIHGEPGSEQFMTAYYRAVSDSSPAPMLRPRPISFPPHSLGRAVLDYYISAKFQALSDSRQKSRRLILNKIIDAAGHELVKNIGKGAIQKGMDRRAKTPSAANEFLKAMRAVLDHQISLDELKANVAKLVSYNAVDTDGFHTWSVEEVAQFINHHKMGSKAVLALALLLFTGQRRGDVIKMGPQHVKDGSLFLKRGKNGLAGTIPILPPLQKVIEVSPSGHLNFIVTEFGKPFSDAGIGNWFRKRCDEAKLPHCSAHGLRKAGATIAAEGGATDEQMMALFGWESRRQVSTYTKKANQKKLALAAGSVVAALIENVFVPPQDKVLPKRDNSVEITKDIK